MNKFKLILVAASIALAMAFTLSCSSDNTEYKIPGMDSYKIPDMDSMSSKNILQNTNMDFVKAPIPTGSQDIITDVQFSGSALSGGSTPLTVRSSKQLKELYLQVEGESGYYVLALTDDNLISTSGGYTYTVSLQFSQNLDGQPLQFTVSGSTTTAEVSITQERQVQTIKAGTGALQISLSWDTRNDVDLHVITPSGREIYYGNRVITATSTAGRAELDIDSNVGCPTAGSSSDKRQENMYFDAPLENGTYTIIVNLFSDCDTGTRYYVSANYNGRFITFSNNQSGSFASTSVVTVGTITVRNGAVVN